ncbi:MAG: hypothetical protein HUU19_12010, partial [Phycisphaerales bacterium]|nr:hypothetical protein [Phycisphaerales bacterium]
MSDASPIMAAGMWDAAPASYRKAPFPAFGGKSRIAPEVWERLGDVRNYVEPFCFSAAMLWKRPVVGAIETINDRNAFVSNFWRAMRADPDAVAHYADWPVNETDLHARHRWLVGSDAAAAKLDLVREDPEAFDAKIAGWWCWGACCWIGSGWCDETARHQDRAAWKTRPYLAGDGGGNGVHRVQPKGQIPMLSIAGGQGVHSASYATGGEPSGEPIAPLPAKLPPMDAAGRGVHGTPNQLPHLDAGKRPRLASFGEAGLGVARDPDPKDRRPGLSQDGWGVNVPGEPTRRRCKLTGNGIGCGVHAGGPDDTHRPQLADEFARGRGVNGHDAAS